MVDKMAAILGYFGASVAPVPVDDLVEKKISKKIFFQIFLKIIILSVDKMAAILGYCSASLASLWRLCGACDRWCLFGVSVGVAVGLWSLTIWRKKKIQIF